MLSVLLIEINMYTKYKARAKLFIECKYKKQESCQLLNLLSSLHHSVAVFSMNKEARFAKVQFANSNMNDFFGVNITKAQILKDKNKHSA